MSTHIRQFHLGIAMTCVACGKKSWAASTWHEHMRKDHPEVAKENYFISDETSTVPSEVKHEVTSID